MSTRPRPRPRPKQKAASTSTSSNSFELSPGKVVQEDPSPSIPKPKKNVDDLFMMSRREDFAARISRQAKHEREAAKSKPAASKAIDSDEDVGESPRRAAKKKIMESGLPTATLGKMPEWTISPKKIVPQRRSSSPDSDVQLIEDDEDEDSPRTKRARHASKDVKVRGRQKGKSRQKSRTPSISPPPKLTPMELLSARELFRENFPEERRRRAASPDVFETSFELNDKLAPELQALAKKVKQGPSRGSVEPSGKPNNVKVTVTYHPHPVPKNQTGDKERSWSFQMRRADDLKGLFEEVARQLGVPLTRLRMCHNGDEVFKLVTLDSFDDIWVDAEFEAYLDETLAYIRNHRNETPKKATPAKSNTSRKNDTDNDEGAVEAEVLDDRIRLQMQSASNAKKLTVTTRNTTTTLSLLVHYLKATDNEMDEATIKKRRIHLQFDGEDLGYDQTVGDIADGELEGGECLDVVGI